MTMKNERKVTYIYSDDLINECDKNPAVLKRASMVHELIKSYELLNYMDISVPETTSCLNLRNFHSENYLNFLKKADYEDDDCSSAEDFGLDFDCPVWPGIYKYCSLIAGSTITASEKILSGADIVLNWFGGWHHAESSKAAGYCYVNDIVLGILELRQKFKRILYIDLDIHYGDGVANAFESTKHVFTLSFHQYEPGFYPGTGCVEDCGFGAAKGYSVNFPYKSGISGESFKKHFKRISGHIFQRYQPQVCVIQCGGDIITGDPLGGANIIPEDIGYCIEDCIARKIPMILLGGGGYNIPNTSRYWTFLTSVVCGIKLNIDIPDSNPQFLSYGPDYEIHISKSKILDNNNEEYLDGISRTIEGYFEKYNLTAV